MMKVPMFWPCPVLGKGTSPQTVLPRNARTEAHHKACERPIGQNMSMCLLMVAGSCCGIWGLARLGRSWGIGFKVLGRSLGRS